jgi:pimeloyl-ACP methyl ester carboxylesterase
MRYFLGGLLLVLVSCVAGQANAPAASAQEPLIDWRRCGCMECGTIEAPLSYSDLNGPTIKLSLIRIAARRPAERIGVLMTNPGGPGGSAIEFASIWHNLLDRDIRDRFDIVAFDPRGVGQSTPVVCNDTLQELVAIDPDPDDDAEWEAAKAVSRRFAEDCARAAGDLLPHVGTRNVARDMDWIREALGEEQITYVGYSYGTTIGSVFASMFPGSVRAMVLDGGTDLSLDYLEVTKSQIIGFERALQAYLDDCAASRCAIARDGSPREALERVIAMAEEAPIPAPRADRDAGPGEVTLGIISAMYSQFSWPQLTRALDEALRGDGSRLVQLTDEYLQRDSRGDYPNLIEANYAVNSVDYACPKDPEAFRGLGEEFAAVAPTFGRSLSTSGLVCAFWEAEPHPLDPPTGAGAPPIVVIATTNDPATPYEWGVALAGQLESSVLVTYRGEGHTIYAQGSRCIDGLVNAYLLTLALPAEGSTCGNGPPPPDSSQPGSETTPPSEGEDRAELGGTTGYWIAAGVLLAVTLALLAVGLINMRRR